MGNKLLRFKSAAAFLVALGTTVLVAPQSWAFVRGEVAANKVNVRAEASLSSDVLFMVDEGQLVDVMEIDGDYYKVNIEMERGLYISRDYVDIVEIIATVSQDDTPFWDKPPSEGGTAVLEVNETFAVNVKAYDDEGYYINYRNKDYFVEKDRLDVPDTVEIPEKGKVKSAPGSDFYSSGNTADDVIDYAKEFLGVRYRYGGSSPSGFDCSGFVSYVLKEFDVSVSRSSASMAGDGVAVDRSELQKGDLLFFATTRGSGRVSHVGMYIGNGEFIHSSTWGEGVVITSLNEAYYSKCFVKARRVL